MTIYERTFNILDVSMPVLRALISGSAVMVPAGLLSQANMDMLVSIMRAVDPDTTFRFAFKEFRPKLEGIRVGLTCVEFKCTLTERTGADIVQSFLPLGCSADNVVPICAVEGNDDEDDDLDDADGQQTFLEAAKMTAGDFADDHTTEIVPHLCVYYVDRSIPPPGPQRKRSRSDGEHVD